MANSIFSFLAIVKRIKPRPNGCLDWPLSVNNKGYGRARVGEITSTRLAHRIMYELTFGPIPEGMHVCHKCDRPICVNPSHLFVGTAKDNMRDASKKGRINHIRFTEHQVETMKSLASSGMGNKGIAKRFGVDESVIKRVLGPRPHPQKVVFTDEQTAEIIALHQADTPLRRIGERYGVSANPIIKLLKENNAFVPPKRGNPLHRKKAI